jgi:hypothetical protein
VTTGNPRDKHLFTVEIWREASEDVSAPWRGVVKHVAHDRQTYFQNLGGLTDFIALRLGAAPISADDEGDKS